LVIQKFPKNKSKKQAGSMLYYEKMRRYIYITIILIIILLFNESLQAAPYFHDSGLVDIPTGRAIEHGIFNVGTYMAFENNRKLPINEVAIKLDFGLLDYIEAGLTALKFNQESYLLGNFKLNLIKESNVNPNISIGLDNIGDKVPTEFHGKRYERSFYLAISKGFNLPYVHLFDGHIGIGNKRYVESRRENSIGHYLHGVFVGVSKEFHPGFIRGELLIDAEIDGRSVNLGMRYWTKSGLQIDLALKAIDSLLVEEEHTQYLFGLSFTNRFIMKQISDVRKLAIQAGRLATQAQEAQIEESEIEDK